MTELARTLALIAGDLDRRGYPLAAKVRDGAKSVAACRCNDDDDDALRCRGCRQPLPPYTGKGRPRVWCSERCRRGK